MKQEDKTLILNTIEARLNEQMRSVDTFTTRAGLVLATCGVVFAGYLQLLAAHSRMISCGSGFFILEVVLVIAAGYFAFASLVPGGEEGRWRHDPHPEKLYKLAKAEGGVDIEDAVIKSTIESYNVNSRIFDEKFTLLKYSRYALYASGSIFILHLALFLS